MAKLLQQPEEFTNLSIEMDNRLEHINIIVCFDFSIDPGQWLALLSRIEIF